MKGLVEDIEIPPYRIVVNVLIHEDCDKAVKLSRKVKKEFYKDHDWKSMYGAYIYSRETNIHAIVLASDAGIDTISHECFHATMDTLKCKGIEYCRESEECFAYVHGYLVKRVWEMKQKIKF